jgi:hypothetical protein
MAWEWSKNNRGKVLEALRTGEYEAILTSKEGSLDAFLRDFETVPPRGYRTLTCLIYEGVFFIPRQLCFA